MNNKTNAPRNLEKAPKYVLYICHDRVKMAGAALSLINLVESIGDSVYTPIFLLRAGVVRDYFKSRGYNYLTFPYQLTLTRSSNPLLNKIRLFLASVINTVCVEYVARRLSGKNVSIVHSNSTATDIGYFIAKRIKAKHVWHVREYLDKDFNTSPIKGWGDMYTKLNNTDYAIAITKTIYYHWHLDNNPNSIVLHDAVRSRNEIEYRKEKEKYFLFCAATLSDQKGANVAIDIFCKSSLYKEGYILKMVGDYTNEYRNELESIANAYEQKEYIDFVGFQADVKPYVLNSTAFLMCSANEALGRVTIEAFFYGCPVLGHNTGGTSELIEDGVNGYLYNTIDEAVSKLRLIIREPEKTTEIVTKAMALAEKKFSNESYGSQIIQIYSILK